MKRYLDIKREFEKSCLEQNKDSSVFKDALSFVLNIPFNKVYFHLDDICDLKNERWLNKIFKRYLEGESFQYILGYTYFNNLKIKVNKNVLIPRFETEELVEWVLKDHKEDKLSVIDIGTGSGCIALAIKNKRPSWCVCGLDISKRALKVAKDNASNLNLDVDFQYGDFLKDCHLKFDVLISNPPYIFKMDKDIDLEVLNNEPKKALLVNDKEGLYAYKKILKSLKTYDFKEAYFEFGYQQKEALVRLLRKLNYPHYEFKTDIAGHDRFLKVYKS